MFMLHKDDGLQVAGGAAVMIVNTQPALIWWKQDSF